MNIKRTDIDNHTLYDTNQTVKNFAFKYKKDTYRFKDFPIRDFFDYVACTIKFTKDPKGVELIQRPIVTMKRRAGDCDCKTVLFLSYLLNKNIPCGFSIVAEPKKKDFHHIFPFIIINEKIFDVDATYCKNEIYKTKPWRMRKNTIIFRGE